MKKAKKHFKVRKIFGQRVVEIKQNAPMTERLKTAKGTIAFKDKTKYNRPVQRRNNKVKP